MASASSFAGLVSLTSAPARQALAEIPGPVRKLPSLPVRRFASSRAKNCKPSNPLSLKDRPARLWLHVLLLIATLVTCSAAGARLAVNFEAGKPAFVVESDLLDWILPYQEPSRLFDGLPFAIALLGILMAHEMGHYLACRHYRLDATLPFFLPGPSLIGTFGAFIRIRSAIFSRRTLFDVGVAGPIAGFVVLVPILLIGLQMSRVVPGVADRGDLVFGTPLLLSLLEVLYFPGVPTSDIYLHPIARAAWVGIFATALNLLPIGQLDGGHIIYALFGQKHKKLTMVALGALIPLGFLYWPWWIWAVVLFFLGRRHPYIFDDEPLGTVRYILAIAAMLIFFLSFMPAPIQTQSS